MFKKPALVVGLVGVAAVAVTASALSEVPVEDPTMCVIDVPGDTGAFDLGPYAYLVEGNVTAFGYRPGSSGDSRVAVYARTPAPDGGQYLYVRYRGPYWETLDGLVLIQRGGFELAGDEGAVGPADVALITDQGFYEAFDHLYRLYYPGPLSGALTLVVKTPDGPFLKAALGRAEKEVYRTGIVTAEEGVPLRAAPSTEAAVEEVLPRGTKVYFTGRETIYASADKGLDEAVMVREVVRPGRPAWAPAALYKDRYPYIKEGGLEELP
jgi:hypothetical protein